MRLSVFLFVKRTVSTHLSTSTPWKRSGRRGRKKAETPNKIKTLCAFLLALFTVAFHTPTISLQKHSTVFSIVIQENFISFVGFEILNTFQHANWFQWAEKNTYEKRPLHLHRICKQYSNEWNRSRNILPFAFYIHNNM